MAVDSMATETRTDSFDTLKVSTFDSLAASTTDTLPPSITVQSGGFEGGKT